MPCFAPQQRLTNASCALHHPFAGACDVQDLTSGYNSRCGKCPLVPERLPIKVVDQVSEAAVTLQFDQSFKRDKLSWISTDCVNPDGDNQDGDPTGTDSGNPTCMSCCPKRQDVDNGLIDQYQRKCKCEDGFATVAVYLHDGDIGNYGPLDYPVPAHCKPSSDQDKKCRFVYKIPCGCGVCALVLLMQFSLI